MRPERLARSGSLSLAGSSIAALVALAVTVLVGNGFGAYGTGLFFQALGIFTIASQVLRIGTNSSIVKLISEQRAFGRRGEQWRTILIAAVPVTVVSLAASAFVFIFAGDLAEWVGGSGGRPELTTLIRDMAPYIVMSALLAVLLTAVRMVRGITAFTLIQNIVVPISRLAFVAIAIVLAWTVTDAFRSYLAVIPIWLVVTVLVLVRPFILDWRERRSAHESATAATRRFWRFSGARAVGAALETALEWSDVLIVAALGSPAEAGIYAVATRVVRAGQVVDGAVRVAVGPTISALLARGDIDAARSLHTSVTRAMILAVWPFYLLLATMGPAVLGLFGPEFIDGSLVLLILAGAMMVASSAGMLQSILLQGGRSSWQMVNKAIALSLSVGLNLILVERFGILGAAVTWATVVLVETVIASWQVHKRMGVNLQPRKLVVAMLLSSGVFGVGGLAVRLVIGEGTTTLLLTIVVLGVVYLGLLWVLRDQLGIISLWAEVPGIRRLIDRRSSPPRPEKTPKRSG